jgi:pimeloyl-ACP methyl ester carboxylesterase
VRKMVLRDVQQTSIESFFRSIGDLHHTSLEPRLGHLRVPVLGVFGEHDVIVDPQEARRLAEGVQFARVHMMPVSGHFPMLDDAARFNETLHHFLEH